MWFLCLSYCLMPPRWTGMSRADTVTLASEGSSAEMRHRKEPPQKGPTPPSHSASSGAGWGSSAHPQQTLFGPLLHPLGSLLLLKWRHSSWIISPPVLMQSLMLQFLVAQTTTSCLRGQTSSFLYLWAHLNHTDAREASGTFCGGKAPQKPLLGKGRNEDG